MNDRVDATARRRVIAASLAGAALFAAPALGQTAAPQNPGPAADTTAPVTSAGDEDSRDITVVARKTSENVQEVPIPVTVIGAATLTRQNLTNFTNFQFKIPAFSVYLTNPKQLNLGIRGIGNNGFNTDGIDGSVGVFVDGVYTGRQGMVSNDFNDLADVEVLRGPQGTLFGKNTTAGAVLINTLKPSFTPGATAEASTGNFGFTEIKGSATGPLVDGLLALRLSAFYSDRDGTYRNLYNNRYQNARQGSGLRGQLLATPADELSIRLIGTHARQSFPTISPVILSIYNPAALQARMAAAGYTLNTGTASNRLINIDGRLDARTSLDSASGQIDWSPGDLGTFTSITGWQRWSCFTNNDNDYTQLDAITDYGSCNVERQVSQELRWETPRGRTVEATFGAFLSRQRLQVDSRIRFGRQYNIWAANPSTTAFPTTGSWAQGAYADRVASFGIRSQAVFHTDTEALFGNATWHPDAARRLAFDIGLRQTWERRSQTYNGVVAANLGNLTSAQIRALSPAGANAQLGQVDTSLRDRALSGEAGVSYQAGRDVFVYGKYARGNKSAGFNLLPYNSSNPDSGVASAIARGAAQTVKGETADNFEAGIKSLFLDRRILLNLTAFHTKVRNYQANQAVGVGNTALKFLANVGSLTSRGIELENETWLVPGLHTKGFIAYDKATYSSFPNSVCPGQLTTPTCDLTGRQVAWAPVWTSDLTVDYTQRLDETTKAYGLVDVNWRSRQNTTITLDPAAEIPAYALASARAGLLLDNERLDLQLWVENLFNKAYFINLLGYTKSTGIVQGYPGNPRSYGFTTRVRF
ncbi:TonB-dependent receptor [Sphingomonas sp. MA1305]|uniref:TonB-dependent receptor n=1 Tax=Sphingomonas sp. MA1305 TaxID=2479204 RepID=UPI0018DF3235|nr:TonB-dependent receptor [Sphingomonas sp. MA1305]MBI0474258.1 TonB-dependent receptor [Sphingomonas sp. MA1305]